MRDRHHETRRHPVARRVAEEHGEPPVGKRDEVVDVAADRVRDLVARPDRIGRGLRELFRDEARLQVARELELVAEVDLVDELHPEQESQQHGRDQEEAAVEIEAVRGLPPHALLDDCFVGPVGLRTAHGEKEAEEDDEEDDAPRRRKTPRKPVEDAVGRPKEPADVAAAGPDRLTAFDDEGLLRAAPLERVEACQVFAPDGGERAPEELGPLLARRHVSAIRSGPDRDPRKSYSPRSARSSRRLARRGWAASSR